MPCEVQNVQRQAPNVTLLHPATLQFLLDESCFHLPVADLGGGGGVACFGFFPEWRARFPLWHFDISSSASIRSHHDLFLLLNGSRIVRMASRFAQVSPPAFPSGTTSSGSSNDSSSILTNPAVFSAIMLATRQVKRRHSLVFTRMQGAREKQVGRGRGGVRA